MKKLMVVFAILCAVTTAGYSQDNKAQRDPKQMTARAAEKLEFSQEQKQALATLNSRYAGDDYDRKQYREEFRKIMTEEQRQKADAMREKQAQRSQKRK